jgi:hypothetical protein
MNPGVKGLPKRRRLSTVLPLSGAGPLDEDVSVGFLMPFGQCYLSKSGANLLLARENGRFLFINGAFRQIPAAGLTLSAAGIQGAVVGVSRARTGNVATLVTAAHGLQSGALALVFSNIAMQPSSATCTAWTGNQTVTVTNATTFTFPNNGADVGTTADVTFSVVPIYFIYAADVDNDGIADTLEPSQIQSAIDPNHGHAIKAGDPTRTLVGMAVSYAGGVWEDDTNHVGVLSYFNRKPKTAKGAFTANRTTGATYANRIELNIEIRAFFLAWGDTEQECWINACASSDTSGTQLNAVILEEQLNDLDCFNQVHASAINNLHSITPKARRKFALGGHLTALASATGTGISSWAGSAGGNGANPRCTNLVTTLG